MVFGRRNAPAGGGAGKGGNELPIPGDALNNPSAIEMLRAWSVNGGLQVALQRNFDDPAIWGLLLTDIARHAARIYAKETAYSEEEALQRIVALFQAEIENPTDLGTTDSARQ